MEGIARVLISELFRFFLQTTFVCFYRTHHTMARVLYSSEHVYLSSRGHGRLWNTLSLNINNTKCEHASIRCNAIPGPFVYRLFYNKSNFQRKNLIWIAKWRRSNLSEAGRDELATLRPRAATPNVLPFITNFFAYTKLKHFFAPFSRRGSCISVLRARADNFHTPHEYISLYLHKK